MKIREFSISFSKKLAKSQRNETNQLLTDLETHTKDVDLNPNAENLAKMERSQNKLEQINAVKTNVTVV